jgi:methylamine dehydrogenase accessory protein MauD
MSALLLASQLASWALLLFLGFVLMGTLRALGRLSWRLEEFQAMTPIRVGREGLKVGQQAPGFTLSNVVNGQQSLHEFVGRNVLLVFTQSGCGPCHDIVPHLNRLHGKGSCQVVVVNSGDLEESRKWAAELRVRFPVLVQDKWSVSKLYQVFATPFAFLLDEHMTILSRGIVSSRQHLRYVVAPTRRKRPDQRKSERYGTPGGGPPNHAALMEGVPDLNGPPASPARPGSEPLPR